MGVQISAGPYPGGVEINRSATASLVATMASPWYDEKRDGSLVDTYGGDYYQQDDVHESSFRAANEVLPWTLEKYLEWEARMFPNQHPSDVGMARHERITRKMFDDARNFVKRCADEGWTASYSY